jgi:tripartite-type tricarboxylate transporter receptor subunit TctC
MIRSGSRSATRSAVHVSFAAAAFALFAAPLVHAQTSKDFPNRRIRIVVPFVPGGPPDFSSRLIAPKLGALFGQPVVVENRGGAGAVLGSEVVAKSPPDGYTWLITTGSHTSNSAFNENVPYDPIRDFTPVTQLVRSSGQVLVVHPTVPAKNVKELIALAKRRPGALNYASFGVGNITYIAAEMLKTTAGIDIVAVQYKGVGASIGDLVGGHVDLCFAPLQAVQSLVQSGRVRAIATTGDAPQELLPGVPTMQDSGFRDFVLIGWHGLYLPAGAPAEIVSRIYNEVVRALNEPDVKQRLKDTQYEIVASKPEEFARYVAQDVAFMRDLARKIQVSADTQKQTRGRKAR